MTESKRNNTDISVLIATYQREEILAKTLDSFTKLVCQELSWELLVVDNAGGVNTRALVESFQERFPVRYLIETCQGKNHALNHAIEEASGELLVFTDDDILVDPRWLEAMWEGARRWPEADMFGGRILPDWPAGKDRPPLDPTLIRSMYAIADWQLEEGPCPTSRVWGGNLAIRSKVFERGWRYDTQVGPSGENYVMGSETELLRRLAQAGYQAVHVPESVVRHQIRPEQLEEPWLLGRAFRYGRFVAVTDEPYHGSRWRGVPRFLYRRWLSQGCRYGVARLVADPTKRLAAGIMHGITRGQLFQHRQAGRSLKIVFLLTEFPSVSETFILSQVTGLIDMGHHVEVVAARAQKEALHQPEVEQYRLKERTRYLPGRIKGRSDRMRKGLLIICKRLLTHPTALLRWMVDIPRIGMYESLNRLFVLDLFWPGRYDIVNCHFGANGVDFAYLKDYLLAKFVCFFHGYDLSSYLKERDPAVYQELFKKWDVMLPTSNHWRKILRQIGCPEDKLVVHRMGIDLNAFKANGNQAHGNGKVRILTTARFTEKKGLEYALQSVAKVATRTGNIDYRIIGCGPLEDILRQMVVDLDAEKYVTFMGAQDSKAVAQLLSESDIFLLPSVTAASGDQEGIPLSLMEAQATGVPVVSSVHTGIPELVQDGCSGFLAPERDVETLADRLHRLVTEPELRAAFGAEGVDIVARRYNVWQLNRQLVGLWRGMLQQ